MNMNGRKISEDLRNQMFADYAREGGERLVSIDDSVVNILNYLKTGMDVEYRYSSGNFRLKYDGDARYFKNYCGLDDENALRGDTMISFWTPYQTALNATGKVPYRYAKSHENINKLIANARAYQGTNQKFMGLAELYHSPGNLLYLPNRGMNPARFQCSEDRIDKSLYECFSGGSLSKFFENNDQKVVEWIRRERLDFLFKNGNIKREMIRPLNGVNIGENYFTMAKNGSLDTYIRNVVALIEYRNQNLLEEERTGNLPVNVRSKTDINNVPPLHQGKNQNRQIIKQGKQMPLWLKMIATTVILCLIIPCISLIVQLLGAWRMGSLGVLFISLLQIAVTFLIPLGAFFLIFVLFTWQYKCPQCKKWLAMKREISPHQLNPTDTLTHNETLYCCKHCGSYKTFVSKKPIPTTPKTSDTWDGTPKTINLGRAYSIYRAKYTGQEHIEMNAGFFEKRTPLINPKQGYIKISDGGTTERVICSQYEFDTGRVIIMKNGKKVDKIK